MSRADIPLGMRLKEIAGWNQVPADWEAYLKLEPEGCFVAELDGKPVATATTLNYRNRFGWIGMVLVDPPARRRGIATLLIETAYSYLDSVGCHCQKLDATDEGAQVYEKMGFMIEYEVERWEGKGGAPHRPSPELKALNESRLQEVARLDQHAFGASRLPLLRWYASLECPRFMMETAYIVGRPGSKAWQMGPAVAQDSETAQKLMAQFLAHSPAEALIVDIVAENREAVRIVRDLGFTRRRVLKRMYRGRNSWPGDPQQTFCLAGFEFG